MKIIVLIVILAFTMIATALAGGFCVTNRLTPMFPSLTEVIIMDNAMKEGGPKAGVLMMLSLVKKGRADIYPSGLRVERVTDINPYICIVRLPDGEIRFVADIFLECPTVEVGK